MTKLNKPPEFKTFEELTKQLLAVPKTEFDRRVRRYEPKMR